ncbi:MAG TPA: hypothetical protein VGL10_04130 [Gammaproteobacteria bacterium]
MNNKDLVCWKCGAELKDVILPLSRREVCAACHADQHVCKLCRHYDSKVAGMCREDRAEQVTSKERANFCDYFDPAPGAYKSGQAAKQSAAKNKLAALFGDAAPGSEDESATHKAQQELQKLFKDENSGT